MISWFRSFISWLWWWWGLVLGNLDDFLLVHGLLNNLLLVDRNLDWFWNWNWIWNLNRHGDLHVLPAHLLDDLRALLVVGDVLYNFVLGLTFLLEGLNTLLLGNINRCLVALCFNSGPEVFYELLELQNTNIFSTHLHWGTISLL